MWYFRLMCISNTVTSHLDYIYVKVEYPGLQSDCLIREKGSDHCPLNWEV